MQARNVSRNLHRLGLGAVLGMGLVLGGARASRAQELPTGAARVVEKVQLMALTGTNEIKYKVDLIVANNASKIPRP